MMTPLPGKNLLDPWIVMWPSAREGLDDDDHYCEVTLEVNGHLIGSSVVWPGSVGLLGPIFEYMLRARC